MLRCTGHRTGGHCSVRFYSSWLGPPRRIEQAVLHCVAVITLETVSCVVGNFVLVFEVNFELVTVLSTGCLTLEVFVYQYLIIITNKSCLSTYQQKLF